MTDRQRARGAGRAALKAPRPHPLEKVLTGGESEQQDGEQRKRRGEQQGDARQRGREHRSHRDQRTEARNAPVLE